MARPKKDIDLADLERLAGLGMTVKDMSRCLGINPDTFYENQKKNIEFSETIARGRIKAIIACAQTVLNAAIKEKNPKFALEYLKRFSDGWKNNPVEIQLEHQGNTAAQRTRLNEKDQEKMALTFLQGKGYKIVSPESTT